MFARSTTALDKDNDLFDCGTMFGAIFMSNRMTKRECFERQLFRLPLSQAGFVRKVKTGMILFLFEYEERKLHGVFEATCDGALNIVPDAYSSSRSSFPAQIRFKRIWSCHPLSENEFRDAIKGNYYKHNKFNFCLSEEQVSDLLQLFARKITQKHRTSGGGRTIIPEFEKLCSGKLRYTTKGLFEDSGVCAEPSVPSSFSHAAESDNSSLAQKESPYSGDDIDSRGLTLGKQLHQSLPNLERPNSVTKNQSTSVSAGPKRFASEDINEGSDFIDLQDYDSQSSSDFDDPSTNVFPLSETGSGRNQVLSHGYSPASPEPDNSREPRFWHSGCESFPPSDDVHIDKFLSSSQMCPTKSDERYSSEPKGDSCPEHHEKYSSESKGDSSLKHQDNSRVPRYWHHSSHHLPLPEDEHVDGISESTSLGNTPYMAESKDSDGSERSRANHPTEDDEQYPTVTSRTSVFSRLSNVPNAYAEEDLAYESDQIPSASQLMELLFERKTHWSKPNVSEHKDTQNVDELTSDAGAAIMKEGEEFYCSDEVTEESSSVPFFAFKRRSKVRGSETETTVLVGSENCNGSSGKNKKRKLIRPSFIGGSMQVLCPRNIFSI